VVNVIRMTDELIKRIRRRTPARVLVDRAGAGYRTATQLELREAHAAARDAVRTEFDLIRDLGKELIETEKIFQVSTRASSKDEYLLRPDRGRDFSERAASLIRQECPAAPDLQIVIGDGLSVTAVATQVPALLPLIAQLANERRWALGRTFAVRYCRVGIMNAVGDLLKPKIVVLLIGERPGLATAKSLSAYMAFRPRNGDNDAQRNLISNIHERGVTIEAAAIRIVNLAQTIMTKQLSGVQVKEALESPKWLDQSNGKDKSFK
jgi:ethanolamine ammonia-lyase small subunit